MRTNTRALAAALLLLSAPAWGQSVSAIPSVLPLPVVQSNVTATQSLSAATVGGAITLANTGAGTLSVTLAGLTASGATVAFLASDNGGASYYAVGGLNGAANTRYTTATADGSYTFSVAGRTAIQISVSVAGTGTITAGYTASVGVRVVTVDTSLASPLYVQIAPSPGGTMKAINVTTAATAGTSSTLANGVTRGFEFKNEGTTACFWSNALAAGTALSATNAQQIAAGASFTSPDWWAPTGFPLTAAATTTTACILSGHYL